MYSSNGLLKGKAWAGLPVSLPFGKHDSEQNQSQELLPSTLFGEVTCWAFGCNKHFFRAYIMFQTLNPASLAGAMWQKAHAILKMSCITSNNIHSKDLLVCAHPCSSSCSLINGSKSPLPAAGADVGATSLGDAQEAGFSYSHSFFYYWG